jgi:hypothetical protein
LLAQAIQSDTYFGNDLYRPSPLFNPYQQHCCCAFKTALP